MATYAAFLRAINVGGRSSLRMSDLRDAFEGAGLQDVRTYIQSGNVLFTASPKGLRGALRQVRATLRRRLVTEPDIIVRSIGELDRIVARAPFAGPTEEPGTKRYVTFLALAPARRPRLPLASDKEALEVLGIAGRDVYVLSRRKPNGFFGFPNTYIEEVLGVSATSRNWTTVTKVLALGRAMA